MIINHFSFEPFLIDSRMFRKGVLLHLAASNGRETTVEVSPLPGHSSETFEDAKEQLSQIKRRIMTTWWSKSALKGLGRMELYPSVYFALEMAILNLLDPIEGENEIQMYSLLFGTPDEILSCARNLEHEGQAEVKVKLGHLAPPDAREVIDALRDRFRLRLDFNRKWKREDSIAFCDHYPEDSFLYMEEPCQKPSKLIDFPYPFALDETLRDSNYLSLLSERKLKALILKPTMRYPLNSFLETGIPCVVTSSFESAVGIRQIRCLIKRLGLENTHHGLDTLRFFDNHHEMSHRLTATASR